MYYICLRYLKHEHDACDLLQESFIQVFKKIQSYGNKGSFEGWLRKIVINKCLEFLRKKKSYAELDQKNDMLAEAEVSIELNIDKKEDLSAILMDAISQLSDGYRTVINLVIIEGYSHKEAAQMIGINPSTSRSQLLRAKAKLKHILETGHTTKQIKNNYDRV